jgi:IS5 family transposase
MVTLYDVAVFRKFCRFYFVGWERAPDSRTLLDFRHLQEEPDLGTPLFAKVGELLLANGMKLHIGVDSQTGLVHSASVTAANVHDSHEVPNLLHGA